MATDITLQAVLDDIAGDGHCDVPFSTLERLFNKECEQDDVEWEGLINSFVANQPLIESCDINWVQARVIFIRQRA